MISAADLRLAPALRPAGGAACPQPGQDLVGVVVGREDGREAVLDPSVAEHEGHALARRLTRRSERRLDHAGGAGRAQRGG